MLINADSTAPEQALRDIQTELQGRRHKTPPMLEEMTRLVIWATAVLNRGAEGAGAPRSVADVADLQAAAALAEQDDLLSPAVLASVRALIERHAQ